MPEGTERRDPAYLRVADALRAEILSGAAPPGARLPSESRLADRFGVSRSSVREALRTLASERLIATTRGATGGSIVQRLEPRHVSAMLRSNIAALANAQGCTTEEMDEVRELLEVTGAWLAALRRSPMDLAALRVSIPTEPSSVPIETQRAMNLDFHQRILAATGNRLLTVFAEPVADVVYERFRGQEYDPDYFARMSEDHRTILAAIEDRDQVGARRAMAAHLRHSRARSDRSPRLLLAGLVFEDEAGSD